MNDFSLTATTCNSIIVFICTDAWAPICIFLHVSDQNESVHIKTTETLYEIFHGPRITVFMRWLEFILVCFIMSFNGILKRYINRVRSQTFVRKLLCYPFFFLSLKFDCFGFTWRSTKIRLIKWNKREHIVCHIRYVAYWIWYGCAHQF